MKIDRRPDGAALEAACLNYAAAIEAERVLRRDGAIVETAKGPRPHPAHQMALQRWSATRAFLTEFGFTPSSRTRVSVGQKPGGGAHDDLTALLSAPRKPREGTKQQAVLAMLRRDESAAA